MLAGRTAKKDREKYRCPLNNDRELCACPKCLNWRYQRLLASEVK